MPRPRSTSVEYLISQALAIEAEAAREAGALGFMARALVQATLPHRKTPGTEFVRRNGAYTLSMLSPSAVGLPYGSVPRLLLAWLCTEAVKTRSRELLLGDNLSGFMRLIQSTKRAAAVLLAPGDQHHAHPREGLLGMGRQRGCGVARCPRGAAHPLPHSMDREGREGEQTEGDERELRVGHKRAPNQHKQRHRLLYCGDYAIYGVLQRVDIS